MQTQQFTIHESSTKNEAGIPVVHVVVKDKYYKARYVLERKMFNGFTALLQSYLAKRPHIDFAHKRNLARPLVYLSPGVKAWAAYMPGGFATYHVHVPESKRLKDGKRIDLITRRLFRHSVDAIGLRSRAHILSWRVHEALPNLPQRIGWLSLAAGSAQPAYDTLSSLPKTARVNLVLTDIDDEVLAFAKQLGDLQLDARTQAHYVHASATDNKDFARIVKKANPHIIDAMGLFEYLDASDASKLLENIWQALPESGLCIFTNMSDKHPHLDLHQRGLGWPGVKPRSVKQMRSIFVKAGIPLDHVVAYRAHDRVYNVYEVKK